SAVASPLRTSTWDSLCSLWTSFNFGVLRLGLFENRDIRIRTLPKPKKILVAAASLGGLPGNGVGPGHPKAGKGADGQIADHSATFEDLLELYRGSFAL